MSKGMDAATMRALGNHLVILADSMGNIIPEKKRAVSKAAKESGKVKKPNAKVEDKGVKAEVDQKSDKMPTKRVVSKKTTTKLVEDKSKEGKSSAQESSSKENKIKTITNSEKVVKSVTKEKMRVTKEEKGRAKVNKKPANQKKQNNVINNDGDGSTIEESIVKKPKVELQKKAPSKSKQNTKAKTDDGVVMTLAKKSKAEKEKVPPQKPKKTNNQRIGDEDKPNGVASKIEKKAVVKRPKEVKQDRAPPKKKQKISTATVESSESEFSINVKINMVEKKKKTAKK